MLQLTYDGTMAGLLSAVFEAYEQKAQDECAIVKESIAAMDAFARRVPVATDAGRARRVWAGLSKKLSREALEELHRCFLSELPEVEGMLLAYMRYAFKSTVKMEEDFGHPAVLWVSQTARKVWREKHRMEAFVRFQELGDGLFYAGIEPDYNVLPLVEPHFRSRYADQSWIIYDLRRKWGLHYDKEKGTTEEVHFEWAAGSDGKPAPEALAPNEPLYEALWQDYFKSTGIPARKNPALHLRHVPLRYWRHLPEKRG